MNDKSLSKFNLDGKWALITGGAGILGKEHAIALLQSGANVVLWDIDEDKLSETMNELTQMFPNQLVNINTIDITIEENVRKAQLELVSKNIVVSILVNNAAINPKYENSNSKKIFSRVENFTISDWNFEISVGLTGAFICSKFFGQAMAENGQGIILNIASDLSLISPDQRIYKIKSEQESTQPVKPITYSVIKSGLIGMTKYLATYWCDSGVRVNALSPGGVFQNQDEDFVKKISNLIPLGRMASKDEFRSVVQFLCSDASSYMTGQNVVLDGGRSIW
jgi:short-subunit dehydrogenase